MIEESPYHLGAFERNYHELRLSEKRIYTDNQIAKLPEIEASHVHHVEWNFRKRSSGQLIALLKKKNKKLNILEVGCGNGWLSAKLAQIVDVQVTGIDINKIELIQAVTVFGNKQNLDFICT